jgi:hypothetical protein
LFSLLYEACNRYERPRPAACGGKGCYAAGMSREIRTYTFTVVVEPADEMWHAYCPTLLAPYLRGKSTSGMPQREAAIHSQYETFA